MMRRPTYYSPGYYQKPTREFSILKWIIFPAMSIVLSGIVAWFNVKIFGVSDGMPYVFAVLLIAAFSVAINKYTLSENRALAFAAFVGECFLTAILIGSASYSLYVQREMSVAGMSEKSRTEQLREIRRLDRGSRREAIRNMGKGETAVDAFKEHQTNLFWFMVIELSTFAVIAFVLYAISHLLKKKQEKQDEQEKKPSSLPLSSSSRSSQMSTYDERMATDIGLYKSARMKGGVATPRLQKTTQDDGVATQDKWKKWTKDGWIDVDDPRDEGRDEPMRRLRLHLQAIKPGFKADRKKDGVWIRLYSSRSQVENGEGKAKFSLRILGDVMTMDETAFRQRLREHLERKGFPI